MTPAEATLAWMRARADASLNILNSSGTRLGTWLVVGNVAALVLVLKAVTDGSGCNPDTLLSAAKQFSAGLFLAFGGWVVGYANGAASQWLTEKVTVATSTIVSNGDYVDRLRREFGDNYAAGELEEGIDAAGHQVIRLHRNMRWLFIGSLISLTLFAASAVSFAQGSSHPLNAGDGLGCAAGKPDGGIQ